MYKGAQGEIEKVLRAMLLRDGIQVGSGAGYPRVEIHSFMEGEPLDKEMLIRECTVIVESMSSSSKGEAVTINDENLALLVGQEPDSDSFHVIGIVPVSHTSSDEISDTQTILYRELQKLKLIIKQK